MKKSLIKGAAIGALAMGMSLAANAATVTLSNFTSSQPDRFAIPATATLTGNLFNIGLVNFKATSAGAPIVADTLSFTITAAANEVIREVIFSETIVGSILGTGVIGGTAEITVNGISKSVGDFLTMSSSGGSLNQTISNAPTNLFAFSIADNLTSATVTITNSMFAAAFAGGTATIEKTLASLNVETSPIPLPPAVWMLGSAIVGLVTVSRRKAA